MHQNKGLAIYDMTSEEADMYMRFLLSIKRLGILKESDLSTNGLWVSLTIRVMANLHN